MPTTPFDPKHRPSPPEVDAGTAIIPSPPVAPRKLPPTKTQVIIMAVVVVAVLGIMALYISNPAIRNSQMGFMFPIFGLTILMGMGGGMFMGRSNTGDNKALSPAALEEVRRSFMVKLDEKRDEIQADAAQQFARDLFLHPEPMMLRGLVGSARMWNANARNGLYFAHVRFGTGTSATEKKLSSAPMGESEDYEPVCLQAHSRFLVEQSKIDGIAKMLALRKHPLLTLVGEDGPDTVYEMVCAMICQATWSHSPQDLRVMVVTDDPDRWDWLKWLPHCQHDKLVDSGGPVRMVWASSIELEQSVKTELMGRKTFGQATADVYPHWLVINDQQVIDGEWNTVCRKAGGGVAGVTFVRMEVRK